MSLFDDPVEPIDPRTVPLPERMRPRTLHEVVGQDEVIGPGRPLREMIDRDLLQSIILWGPPGTGKTTLARLIADVSHAQFVSFSAVLSGIKEVKDVMAAADTNIAADAPGRSGEPYIQFGYGGVELEYVHQWDRLMHLSFGLLIGGGSVGCRAANGSNSGDAQSFFALEPWVNGNLNVTDFFRISVGVSYRWVTGANSPAASDSDLSGVAGILLLRFGSF